MDSGSAKTAFGERGWRDSMKDLLGNEVEHRIVKLLPRANTRSEPKVDCPIGHPEGAGNYFVCPDGVKISWCRKCKHYQGLIIGGVKCSSGR